MAEVEDRRDAPEQRADIYNLFKVLSRLQGNPDVDLNDPWYPAPEPFIPDPRAAKSSLAREIGVPDLENLGRRLRLSPEEIEREDRIRAQTKRGR